MGENRLRSLDIAKGIAIILVVIGHAIPDATTAQGISSFALGILFSIIYSFHMPLFFLISGYFVDTVSETVSRKQQIGKKFQRLMVPYLFVGLAYAPCKLLLSQYANAPFQVSNLWKMVIGVNPDGELWFLYSMFVISAFAYAMRARVGIKWMIGSCIIGGGGRPNPEYSRKYFVLSIFLFPRLVYSTASSGVDSPNFGSYFLDLCYFMDGAKCAILLRQSHFYKIIDRDIRQHRGLVHFGSMC